MYFFRWTLTEPATESQLLLALQNFILILYSGHF